MNSLETKKIPLEWKEAKMTTLHRKGDMEDIKNYRPITLLSHMYKLFTWILQKEMEKVLDENQQREQDSFRKGFPTVDHLQTINQLMEKCNEINRPLCIRYIDYEKAFDSTEHEAIFKALITIGINETYITIIEEIYTGVTARVYMDNEVTENITLLRGPRQEDPISPQTIHSLIMPSKNRKE